METVGLTAPARGALRCERLADDTLLVRLVGHWTIHAGAPVVTEVYEQLDASPPVRRLAFEDQSQAEEGLVALTSSGKVYYKPLEELVEGDMAARIAADRLRESWLKERRDGWLSRPEGSGEGRL